MELLTLLLKFVGISAILTVIYYLIYARTASYLQCRVYLTVILFVSCAISLSEIKIYPAAVQTIEVTEVEPEITAQQSEYFNEDGPITPIQTTEIVNEIHESPFSVEDWVLAIYLTVTTLLLLRYFYQAYKIINITHWGSVTTTEKYKLVRNNKVASPFSYFKNIYINRKLDNYTLEVVLQHELCHIKHRHYIDTMIMEFASIILWFNPLTWIIKHELRNIHEFQVDNSLIRNGLDIPKYQNILFAELMGYSPNIANGLHNSLIKKRFIMMTHNRVIKYGLLRKLLVAPIIIILFVLFSFREKDDVIRYISIPQTTDVVNVDRPSLITKKAVAEPEKAPQQEPKAAKQSEPFKSTLKDTVIIETVVTKTIKNDNDSTVKQTITKNETKHIILNKQQLVISNRKVNSPKVKYIETMPQGTLITVIVPITGDNHYLIFPSTLNIINPKTDELFPIISVMKDTPLNIPILINDMKGKCLEFTMIFTPLKEEIEFIDISNGGAKSQYLHFTPTKTTNQQALITSTPTFAFRDLEIENYKKINFNYLPLTAEQTPTIQLPAITRDGKLLSVERTETETKVTFATKIYYDSQWVMFGSGILLRDCKTKEKYYIKHVEKDIPLNRLCVVNGKKDKFVMYTMVFPRLSDDVTKIDIIDTPNANNTPTPQKGTPLNWYEIGVKNGKFDPDNNNTFRNTLMTHSDARLETTIESKGKPRMSLVITNNRSTRLTITLNKSEVITIPSNFAIRDVASGKLYRAKNMRPYNFDVTTMGRKNTNIYIEFNILPYGVDRIDIGVFTKNMEIEHPWSYKNIDINN